MAVASLPRKAHRKAHGGRTGGGAPIPWWGEGLSPLERWPGVTIQIPAVFRSATDRWESPDGAFFFGRDAADKAADFFPDLLTHHMGEFAGRPFDLLAYQKLLLTRPIFGWKRTSDGFRRFRKLFAFIPKGGGKSPWAAGTGLYLARCDGEMAAEVYALANDRTQARTVHTNAKYMVEDSPLLNDGCEILKDSIYWLDSRSMFMVLSSDASSAHGKRPHGLIFDELHGYSGDRDRELFEALKKSLIKRRQPVLAMITHAGTDDESVCHEEYEYAKGLLSETFQDDTCLPVIFEAQPSDDVFSVETHRRVNPGYGVTVKADAVEGEFLEAHNDPRKLNDVKRYHLNIWTNQATAWIVTEDWDANNGTLPPDAELALLPCAAGLDMAQKWDLACFAVTFRMTLKQAIAAEVVTGDAVPQKKSVDLNYEVAIVPFFWIPEDTMKLHEQEDRVPYARWVELGLVTVTEGATIDYSRIYSDIVTKILPRFPRLKQGTIGYDPAFATDIATQLRDRGGLQVAEVLQNYTHLSEVCHIFEALVKARRVRHGGHRVLRNHIENVAVKTDDAGRIRPVKPKRAGKHIDGVVSSLMGVKMLALVPEQRSGLQIHFLGART